MSSDSDKKLWTWKSTLIDHVRILVRIPIMLVTPFVLSSQQMEAIQSSVSEVNASNISTVWHRSMQRISGLNAVSGVTGVEIFIRYGRTFGMSDGTGNDSWDVYDEIITGKGKAVATASVAAAYLQLWMDLTGNTIGGFLRGTLKCNKREGQSVLFEIIFFLYYFPMYCLMAIGSQVLRVLPANAFFYKISNFIHILVAASYIIPVGLLGLLTLPLYIWTKSESSPLPSRQDYAEVPGNDGAYTINLVKPSKEAKVGIRFGSNTAGQVMITNIKKTSIASTTDLHVGDTIFSINGETVSGWTPKRAAKKLLESSGVVTIVASVADASVYNEEATV